LNLGNSTDTGISKRFETCDTNIYNKSKISYLSSLFPSIAHIASNYLADEHPSANLKDAKATTNEVNK